MSVVRGVERLIGSEWSMRYLECDLFMRREGLGIEKNIESDDCTR